MKMLLVLTLLYFQSYAEYTKRKIDMHGEKASQGYNKKSDFKNAQIGIVMFLDKNITKKGASTKK